MWILFWQTYKHCKAATALSFIGALTTYCGVSFVIAELYVPGLIMAAAGIAIRFGADKLAKSKAKKLQSSKSSPAPIAHNAPVQPASKQCPHCGNGVPTDSKFCNVCGFMIIKDKICLRCGIKLNPADKFCNNCGYPCK